MPSSPKIIFVSVALVLSGCQTSPAEKPTEDPVVTPLADPAPETAPGEGSGQTSTTATASPAASKPKPAAQTDVAPVDRPVSDNPAETTLSSPLKDRFALPAGYDRIEAPAHSFAAYLQNLPLKPEGAEVKYYNGQTKHNRNVYVAVVDIDVGTRDLQQCADAIMRLRAEHLWAQQAYDDIHFNFTNGFRVDYSKWRAGYRVKIEGNKTNWYKAGESDSSYKSFRRYMDLIFTYAGTWSLSQELNRVSLSDMQIGDVFIQGGSPGHAVIVVDMAVRPGTGEKIFLLAQSYMPAQDIQILQNPMNDALSPWYEVDFGETLYTPEWTFQATDLKRFP